MWEYNIRQDLNVKRDEGSSFELARIRWRVLIATVLNIPVLFPEN
jgi:hypothetical protein